MTLPINTIVNADVLAYLRRQPDECAHCCVTSPPYWGLRDYGLAPSHWEAVEYAPMAGLPPVTVPAMDACLGLEKTPDAFVGHIVAVFREVWRVLRKDGTLWINFGDSYVGSWGAQSRGDFYPGTLDDVDPKYSISARQIKAHPKTTNTGSMKKTPGLKPKDLVGIPWRVALALQADGWYLRSDVIWAKPNPMPESVTDRPNTAHEHVFLLTKNGSKKLVWRDKKTGQFVHERPNMREWVIIGGERKRRWTGLDYYYNAEAVKEVGVTTRPELLEFGERPDVGFTGHMNDRRRAKGSDKQSGHGRRHAGFNERWDAKEDAGDVPGTRNLRSVWTIATQAFAEAHFATFPPELPKRCIMAGCPQGGVVLEPFAGAGTVPLVATGLGRNWLACELNPEYVEIANRRLHREVGLLLEAGNA